MSGRDHDHVVDHGRIRGLRGDDHAHYLNVERHDDDDHSGLIVDSTHLVGLGAWTDYSGSATFGYGATEPTLVTVNYARYSQIGKTVFYSYKFTVTTAGSASGTARWSLPVTPESDSDAGCGSGVFLDGSTRHTYTHYIGTTAYAYAEVDQDTTSLTAGSPFAIGDGDVNRGLIIYEAA